MCSSSLIFKLILQDCLNFHCFLKLFVCIFSFLQNSSNALTEKLPICLSLPTMKLGGFINSQEVAFWRFKTEIQAPSPQQSPKAWREGILERSAPPSGAHLSRTVPPPTDLCRLQLVLVWNLHTRTHTHPTMDIVQIHIYISFYDQSERVLWSALKNE